MYSIKPCNLVFDGHRPPYASDFSDLYYSSKDGLAEARYVFCDGVDLKGLLRSGRRHLTIAETGFGTGLNFLATMKEWQATGGKAPLTYVSVEGFPMDLASIQRAWQPFRSELAEEMDALARAYPPVTPGFHLRQLFGGRVKLLLLFGKAEEVLPLADFKAQAWYLDGFAPARNQDLWNADLFAQIGRLSDAGAKIATFSAARVVKEGCDQIKAAWTKRPGFAGKRECLVAQLPGQAEPEPELGPIQIVGAGIAGASLVSALHQAGQKDIQVIDAGASPGAGASGNPIALVEPRLSHVYAPDIELLRLAYLQAIHRYDAMPSPSWIAARGLSKKPRDEVIEKRFGLWLSHQLLPSDWMQGSAQELFFPQAGGLSPAQLLTDLLQCADVSPATNKQLSDQPFDGLRILATGALTPLIRPELAPWMGGNLGQLMQAPSMGLDLKQGPISRSGYMAHGPNQDLIAGASYQSFSADQLQDFDSASPRPEHLDQVRARLADLDPDLLKRDWVFARSALRSVAKDRNPLVGALDDQTWILAGLGSRGFTSAPLFSEFLVAKLLKRPSPIPIPCAKVVNPLRFATRSAKKV